MATVSDELVERVANVIDDGMLPRSDCERYARAAIAALSTPEFVLPLAEEMLRVKAVYAVELQTVTVALRDHRDQLLELEETLLDAYRAAKGE